MGDDRHALDHRQDERVDPHAWLNQTLQRIAGGWPNSQIADLMPWNFKP